MNQSQPPEMEQIEQPERPQWTRQVWRFPVVSLLLVLCLLLALVTRLGDSLAAMAPFTFNMMVFEAGKAYLVPLQYGMEEGHWWRWLTPVFLHFGVMHLTMNMLWLFELGRRIEFQHGSVFLLALVVVGGVVSNYTQYWFSGPILFGGMSGVLYALLGFCWIYQRVNPQAAYLLPKGVVGLMLAWLLVCLSGVITMLGMGDIANAAHVSGLLLGYVAGALFAVVDRFAKVRNSID